ncbi:primosomal protein [Quadrisphaera sp. KR29]|uniref:primosomal protein n=1 Tax=Quadrisphaera sp. KR29 TaxID=3461391 RepID=UPI004043CFDD
MATDPRAALDRLVAALEAHLAAAQRRRGDDDPAVEAAYSALADAFEVYEESLYTAYEEVTPFELFDEDEDGLDEDDDEDDDDDLDDDAPESDEDDDGDGAAGGVLGGGGTGGRGRVSRR